ncbi:MAG: D-aminoacyl-tRNA deacylase [Myxococcota bacterium]
MNLVLQRVDRAIARKPGSTSAVVQIDAGLVIYLGFVATDTEAIAKRGADKVANMRIIEKGESLFGRSLVDSAGQALVLFQLPVVADMSRGRRPNFSGAAPIERAAHLYEAFTAALAAQGVDVVAGPMQQTLSVEVHNRGPFTLPLQYT